MADFCHVRLLTSAIIPSLWQNSEPDFRHGASPGHAIGIQRSTPAFQIFHPHTPHRPAASKQLNHPASHFHFHFIRHMSFHIPFKPLRSTSFRMSPLHHTPTNLLKLSDSPQLPYNTIFHTLHLKIPYPEPPLFTYSFPASPPNLPTSRHPPSPSPPIPLCYRLLRSGLQI